MALDIRTYKTSEVIIVHLSGRLDTREPALPSKIAELIAQGERRFLLNLTGLEYIDAAGLGQLVTICAAIRQSGGSLTLTHLTKHIRTLLTITKLDTVLHICEADATESLQASFPASIPRTLPGCSEGRNGKHRVSLRSTQG